MRLDAFARRSGLHPDMVSPLVALGLLRCQPDAGGELWFTPSELAFVARFRAPGWDLNYAAIGLVLDLLDRIEGPETTSRSRRKSQQFDAEVAGGIARIAEHRNPHGSHRGRWRTSTTSPNRPSRQAGAAAAEPSGADTSALQADLERELDRRPRLSGPVAAPGQVSLTPRLAKVLDAAERETKRLKDEHVSVERLVIALAQEGKSTAARRSWHPLRRHVHDIDIRGSRCTRHQTREPAYPQGLPRVPAARHAVGAFAVVPDMWTCRLLRFVTDAARRRALS